jgi:hypothetical protein
MQVSRRARTALVVGLAVLASCESTASDDDDVAAPSAATTATDPTATDPPGGPAGTGDPTIHEPLAALVPALEGIELTPVEGVDWDFYDLPAGTLAWAAGVSGPDGAIGRLVIAEGTGQVPLVPTYVSTIFTEGVPFVGTAAPEDTTAATGTVVTAANLRPAWRAGGEAAVAVATVDAGGLGAWIWEQGGRLWIMRGRVDTGAEYVTQLLAATGAGDDPYDDRILSFTLRDRLIDVPDYRYVDVPRSDILGQLPETLTGSCTESIYLGYVVPEDDPDPQTREPDDLGLYMSTVAGICEEAGFTDELVEAFEEQEDLLREQLGGQDVYRSDREVIAIDGPVITHFLTEDPATLTAMEPFMEAFLAGQ